MFEMTELMFKINYLLLFIFPLVPVHKYTGFKNILVHK